MELAIGIVVVVGIILLLGRLADWFEERSFFLWLVFYLLAGGLTIVLFGPLAVTSRPRGSDHLVHRLAWLARGEPPGSGAAAHPANHVILGKAVLQAPFLEPIDIHRIRQVPRRLDS